MFHERETVCFKQNITLVPSYYLCLLLTSVGKIMCTMNDKGIFNDLMLKFTDKFCFL